MALTGDSGLSIQDRDVHGHAVAPSEASGQQVTHAPTNQGHDGEVAEVGGVGGDQVEQRLRGDVRGLPPQPGDDLQAPEWPLVPRL